MICPFCGRELVLGMMKRYETLSEHVSNPNKEVYPLSPTWICRCPQTKELFWDKDGYAYGRGEVNALNTFAHRMDTTLALQDWMRPLCLGARFPYDTSYRIAQWLSSLLWPILCGYYTVLAKRKELLV